MKYSLVILILLFTLGCTKQLTVNEIIDKSIEAYGGEKVLNSVVNFDFRDKHYSAKYHNYYFQLLRQFKDSTGQIIDELTNNGFKRTVNDSLVTLNDEWTGKYSRSVNSVIYFFRIPFVLKDGAVNPELLEASTIKDQNYYKVRITFRQEGGGDDYDDSFIYWINQDNFYIDYFAYSYSTDGGGKRFREAIRPRNINGLHVVDYINFEPIDQDVPIDDYDQYFVSGGMTELSRIENKNVIIEYLQ